MNHNIRPKNDSKGRKDFGRTVLNAGPVFPASWACWAALRASYA
jgi:hypothetical protein